MTTTTATATNTTTATKLPRRLHAPGASVVAPVPSVYGHTPPPPPISHWKASPVPWMPRGGELEFGRVLAYQSAKQALEMKDESKLDLWVAALAPDKEAPARGKEAVEAEAPIAALGGTIENLRCYREDGVERAHAHTLLRPRAPLAPSPRHEPAMDEVWQRNHVAFSRRNGGWSEDDLLLSDRTRAANELDDGFDSTARMLARVTALVAESSTVLGDVAHAIREQSDHDAEMPSSLSESEGAYGEGLVDDEAASVDLDAVFPFTKGRVVTSRADEEAMRCLERGDDGTGEVDALAESVRQWLLRWSAAHWLPEGGAVPCLQTVTAERKRKFVARR